MYREMFQTKAIDFNEISIRILCHVPDNVSFEKIDLFRFQLRALMD